MRKIRITLIIVLILEISYFSYLETNDITIIEQEINDSNLEASLGDLRVIQISDLHVGSIGIREKKLVDLINKIAPDIIFITGDFISTNKGIKPCMKVLKELVSGHLVIAILGNSDHSYKSKIIDTELLVEELKRIGIKVLINESLKLIIKENKPVADQILYIVGLDDNFLWFDDIFKAMNNVPENSPKILLAHSPHIIEKINIKGINLILSGHTHGGQIVLPFIGPLHTNPLCNARKRFVSGLYNEDTKLYVNRGVGTAVIPLRLFCKPEITLFQFIAE